MGNSYKKVIKKMKSDASKSGSSSETNEMLQHIRLAQESDLEIRKNQLYNVLNSAERLLEGYYSQMTYTAQHPIFSYIKIFTDAIQNQQAVEVLKNGRDNLQLDDNIYFNTVEALYHPINNILFRDIWEHAKRYELKDLVVSNGRDPILASIWTSDRIVDNITNIGKGMSNKHYYEQGMYKDNSFEYIPTNHMTSYIYPLGITQVKNGHHSIFAGMNKGEGEFIAEEIYDVSYLYDIYHFDGTYLVNEETGDKEAIIFEIGAIFEIGRLLLLYPDVFPFDLNSLTVDEEFN